MASSEVAIPVQRVMKDLTLNVTVTGIKQFQWRIKIALFLMRLASRIAGCGFDLKVEKADALQKDQPREESGEISQPER